MAYSALSALMTSALANPVSSFESGMQSLRAIQPTSSSGASKQSTSSLQLLAEDTYTSSSAAALPATAVNLAAQLKAQSPTSLESATDLAAATSSPSASSSTQDSSGDQTDSPMASALNTAEQDGIAVAQWMEEQATTSDPSQAASSAAGDQMSAGASLVAKFSDDLNQIGNVIDQTISTVAKGLQSVGINSSEISSETSALKSTLTLDAIDALGNTINPAMSAPGQNFSLGFSDTALSLGSSPTDGMSQLSLHISNYNLPGSTVDTAQPHDFALVFDSSNSSAAVSEASSSANSDGSVTATAVAAASDVEQYAMYTVGQVQTGDHQSTLTTASMTGTISNTVGIGVSETTDGSASSQAAVEIDTSSETDKLSMASTTVNAVPSGRTDAALITSWNRSLGLSTWGTMPAGGSSAKAEVAFLARVEDSQSATARTANESWKTELVNAYADGSGGERAASRGDHRVDMYA